MTKITWFVIFFRSSHLHSYSILLSAIRRPPILVDQQSGKYLGDLNANPYDPNSASNPYGKYGSEYNNDNSS